MKSGGTNASSTIKGAVTSSLTGFEIEPSCSIASKTCSMKLACQGSWKIQSRKTDRNKKNFVMHCIQRFMIYC